MLSRELQSAIDERPNFTRDNNSHYCFVLQKKHVELPLVGSRVLQNIASGGILSSLVTGTGHMLAVVDHKALYRVDILLVEHLICRVEHGGGGVWKAQGGGILPVPLRGSFIFMLCLGQGM